jgi:hypothetical protein
MTSACKRWLRAVAVAAAVTTAAAPAAATGAPKTIGGHRVGVPSPPRVVGPAGPTPLNPAGPTPLNPAGPTPLNPTGPSVGFPRLGVPVAPAAGVHVGIVGSRTSYGAPPGGSFFCQVHNRGYASESLFFDHLATADGVHGDDALPYLYDDGGVWIFPAE